MFYCVECEYAMETLAPVPGASTAQMKKAFAEETARLVQELFDQEVPRGRGHTLNGIIWLEKSPGRTPTLPNPLWTRLDVMRWLAHLDQADIRSEADLLDHIGGKEDEIGVECPPDVEAFLRAFRAIQPWLEPGTRKKLLSKEAAHAAIAAAKFMSVDAVWKAVRRRAERATAYSGDHREVMGLCPNPGVPQLFLDLGELERRHPGVWEKLEAGAIGATK